LQILGQEGKVMDIKKFNRIRRQMWLEKNREKARAYNREYMRKRRTEEAKERARTDLLFRLSRGIHLEGE